MKFTILTLFPEMFQGPFEYSIIKRAKENGIISIDFVNIRDFASDTYKTVDDHPYGGGVGMILKVDVVDKALQSIKDQTATINNKRIILLDPRGPTYTQQKAKQLTTYDHLIFICGHYEGVDERIRTLVDEEISIGDFIVTGGELPTILIVDSIARLLKGTLKKETATSDESFQRGLEYPQYTKPQEYNGQKVPDVLLSGNHKKIQEWKEAESKKLTQKLRPDLYSEEETK